jgi:hypothetical protein
MAIIQLTTCNNSIEASFLKNMLENEGIDCFLTNEISMALMPGYMGMMNAGVQLMIDEKDVEKATTLIEKPESENIILCPNCHSTNISYRIAKNNFKKIVVILVSMFAWMPIGVLKENCYCKDCKIEF